MTDVIITTGDARALISLVDHIEALFPVGTEYDPSRAKWTTIGGAHAPTGEPYVELTGRDWQPSREAVLDYAKGMFEAYAKGKRGTLYWRVRPEIAQDYKQGWRFYMRLLISDTPCQSFTSSTTPKT